MSFCHGYILLKKGLIYRKGIFRHLKIFLVFVFAWRMYFLLKPEVSQVENFKSCRLNKTESDILSQKVMPWKNAFIFLEFLYSVLCR